jgi:hypothetical protein
MVATPTTKAALAEKARRVMLGGPELISSEMAPPVSFVAIGLFVTTIGFSIGLDADFFRDVTQGRLALVQANSQPINALRAVSARNGPHCP